MRRCCVTSHIWLEPQLAVFFLILLTMLWASLLALASFAARVVQKEPARSVAKFSEVLPKATAFQVRSGLYRQRG